jgi:hypothetical protein
MRIVDRSAKHDDGFAMIATVIVIMVIAILATALLAIGVNTDRHTGQEKNWTAALHVADAGVQRAIALLGTEPAVGLVPAPFTGSTPEGSYSTTVTYLGRATYQIDSTGSVGTAQTLTRGRKIRVLMAPPESFKYALFSSTDINTKNNNQITGDIWANGSVTVYNGDTVTGSVNAATGWVQLQNGSTVTGSVLSGGVNGTTSIEVDTGATIGKDATAASTVPDCADDPAHGSYSIYDAGTIGGTATAWGRVNVIGTANAVVQGLCIAAPATKPMPNFTLALANYNPTPTFFSSVASFQTYLASVSNNLSGVFQVCGTGIIDLTGVKIAGDTTIIAGAVLNHDITQPDPSCPAAQIFANGLSAVNNSDKVLTLVSYYNPGSNSTCTNTGGNPDNCALGFMNNFQPNDNTATLLYAPVGPCAMKNNSSGSTDTFTGAVYCNNIVMKNNQNITYDPRIDRIVGFGPVTLQQQKWQELNR